MRIKKDFLFGRVEAAAIALVFFGFSAQAEPTSGNALDMEFVYVKPGTFEMGSDSDKASPDEQPVHEVKISGEFWIGKFPVTQKEYEELMGMNPSSSDGVDHPVEQVSWHDAVDFCEKLTAREREAGRLPEGYVYRLPTEAEWEYAARGGQQSKDYIYAGSDNVDVVAWHRGNREGRRTHQVGRKKPNELGICDMSGNVYEWCYDWYDFDYYEDRPREDPVNTSRSSSRVLRGGCWYSLATCSRLAYRLGRRPDHMDFNLGFRVVLAPAVQL